MWFYLFCLRAENNFTKVPRCSMTAADAFTFCYVWILFYLCILWDTLYCFCLKAVKLNWMLPFSISLLYFPLCLNHKRLWRGGGGGERKASVSHTQHNVSHLWVKVTGVDGRAGNIDRLNLNFEYVNKKFYSATFLKLMSHKLSAMLSHIYWSKSHQIIIY